MPVIRGPSSVTALSPDRRSALLEQLRNEIASGGTAGGPVIFEIPLEQSDKMDVLVVWPAFEALRSEDCTTLIMDAFADKADKIAQALGVTYQEALDQQLLPYAVQPMSRSGEADPAKLREAMVNEGGIGLPGGKVDLRFPTAAMAKEAHHRLCERLPNGYWSIVYEVARIP